MDLITEIILFLTFLINLFLAAFVYLKNKKGGINKAFSFGMFCSACWSLFLVLTFIFQNQIFGKISTTFGLFANTGFVLFSLALLPNYIIKKRNFILILLPPFIISFFILFSSFIVKGFVFYHTGMKEIVMGPFIFIFYIFHLSYALWFFMNLFRGYKISTGIEKLQFKYLFVGVILTLGAFIFTNLILPLFGIHQLIFLSSIFLAILGGVFVYAITRYRLMDIQLAIKKGTVHLISIILILSFYTALIFFSHQILIQKYNWNYFATTLGAIFLIAISIEPLRRQISKTLSDLFYSKKEKGKIVSARELKSLATGKNSKSSALLFSQGVDIHLAKLVSGLVNEYLKAIGTERVLFLCLDAVSEKYKCIHPQNNSIEIKAKGSLSQYLSKKMAILLTQEIPFLLEKGEDSKLVEISKYLKENKIQIVLPIGERGNLMGLFLFSNKNRSDSFTKEDIAIIEDFKQIFSPILLSGIMYKLGVEGIV